MQRYKCKRPLVENTLRRIAFGVVKYILDDGDPFIVPASCFGEDKENEKNDEKVCAFITKFYKGSTGSSCNVPFPTICPGSVREMKAAAACQLGPISVRMNKSLVKNHSGEERVVAFLSQYYGRSTTAELFYPFPTVTVKDKFGLVVVKGFRSSCSIKSENRYILSDIGFRMLHLEELKRAQGFPENYRISQTANKKRSGSKSLGIKIIGNSVCPPLAKALVKTLVESKILS